MRRGKVCVLQKNCLAVGLFVHNHIWLVALIENQERGLESG